MRDSFRAFARSLTISKNNGYSTVRAFHDFQSITTFGGGILVCFSYSRMNFHIKILQQKGDVSQ
jgi:hypothetical protein